MKIPWASVATVYVFCFQPCLSELRLLMTIYRHGNKNPTRGGSYYPKDPYVDMDFGPEGSRALTSNGKSEAYKLGQFFRERYDEFLGPLYSKDTIWFRADTLARVEMTAQLVAAGMYPPYGEQKWHPHLNWQPIIIWTPPTYSDYLYNSIFCKNFEKWRNEVERTDPVVTKRERENKDVYEYISQHTGGNITQGTMLSLHQLLYAEKDIGLKLPDWTKSVYPGGKLGELAAYDIFIRTRTLKLKQLYGGLWIQEWLKTVDNYLNKNDTRKAFMYCAHELILTAVLVTLDSYDYHIPAYCAALIFELHEENNNYYVKLVYKNKDDVRIIKILGCNDDVCPLDIFRIIVAPLMTDDPAALCGGLIDNEWGAKHKINH